MYLASVTDCILKLSGSAWLYALHLTNMNDVFVNAVVGALGFGSGLLYELQLLNILLAFVTNFISKCAESS